MNTKSMIGGVLVGAFLLGASSLAAQSAPVVWDTAEGAIGNVDQHYTVIGFIAGNPPYSNAAYFSAAPSYTSVAPQNASLYSNGEYALGLNFISSALNGGSGLSTVVYQVTFNLDAASIISGMWAADNGGVIYNNGNFVTGLETIANGPETNYSESHAFSFAGVAGANVLNFFITDGGAPSAFAFDVESVRAAAVPGPVLGAGLPGLVMALGGLLVLRRRRMAAA